MPCLARHGGLLSMLAPASCLALLSATRKPRSLLSDEDGIGKACLS